MISVVLSQTEAVQCPKTYRGVRGLQRALKDEVIIVMVIMKFPAMINSYNKKLWRKVMMKRMTCKLLLATPVMQKPWGVVGPYWAILWVHGILGDNHAHVKAYIWELRLGGFLLKDKETYRHTRGVSKTRKSRISRFCDWFLSLKATFSFVFVCKIELAISTRDN